MIYTALPEPVKAVLGEVGKSLLHEAMGTLWGRLKPEEQRSVFAPIYKKWRDSLTESEASDKKLAKAFEEFFCRHHVRRELHKVMNGGYHDVDFQVLRQELHESCEYVNCPVPGGGLVSQIDLWVRGLKTMLERDPAFQERFHQGIATSLRQAEDQIENDSVARAEYLSDVEAQNGSLRFGGLPPVGGMPSAIELVKVFVMPDVQARPEFVGERGEDVAPAPAHTLLTLVSAPRQMVILGGPGAGKTTLLQSFCLGFTAAGRSRFKWSQGLPELLPVFYRVKHLEEDLQRHTTIWDAIAHRCSHNLSRTLPAGFFRRQMESAGLILFFDGLDETRTAASRSEVTQLIGSFARGLSRESRVAVSSRPYEYRNRLTASHYQLCPFDDGPIKEFIGGWQRVHVKDKKEALEKEERLWKALEPRPEILALARNTLLLTMIVRVHFGMGVLPESRVNLYKKCSDCLLGDWARAAGLEGSALQPSDKEGFLSQLAFDMQTEFGAKLAEMEEGSVLQIGRKSLTQRLKRYLLANGPVEAVAEVDNIVHWLHVRDGILVHHGEDDNGEAQFGFLHRSFQEYFAAAYLADHPEEVRLREKLEKEPLGWNETLYLAVAQLSEEARRGEVLDLVRRGRPDFAWQCLRAGGKKEPGLRALVQYLAGYYRAGIEAHYSDLGPSAKECAEACIGYKHTVPVLQAMFEKVNREGQSLAAAFELAEALAALGSNDAQAILENFLGEHARYGLDSTENMAWIDGFYLDKYPVTNQQFERMIPGHRKLRGRYSDTDDHPVIYVNWFEARLFCRWRGSGFRLPDEAEWYKAASWDSVKKANREYPWGNKFDLALCNTFESRIGKTTPVGAYPRGVSAYGCYDMAGNVWEWMDDESEGGGAHALRGGSWLVDRDYAACSFRVSAGSRDRSSCIGFRCVRP